MVNMRVCFLVMAPLLAVTAFAPPLKFLGDGSARPSCDKVFVVETASSPTLASSRRPAPGLFRRTSVLRLTTSSGEEPDDEEPDTPKVPSELEIVLEEIKEAKSKRDEYKGKCEAATSVFKEQLYADLAKDCVAELATLREKGARLEAPSAPSKRKLVDLGAFRSEQCKPQSKAVFPPIVGRRDSIDMIMRVVRGNFNSRMECANKGLLNFLLAAGHVRLGKTRLGFETMKIVDDMRTEMEASGNCTVTEPVCIKIDFTNGVKFNEDFDPFVKPREALAARIASWAFEGVDFSKLTALDECNLEVVFANIVESALLGQPDDAVVPIVVLFDEHNFYNNQVHENNRAAAAAAVAVAAAAAAPAAAAIAEEQLVGVAARGSQDSPFKALYRELGSVMFDNTAMNYKPLAALHKAGRFFAVPIATGTSVGDVPFNITHFPLIILGASVLTFDESKQLAFSWLEQHAGSSAAKTLLKDPWFLIALGDTGGFPGFIQFLCSKATFDEVALGGKTYAAALEEQVQSYMRKAEANRGLWSRAVRSMMSRVVVCRSTEFADNMTFGDLADRGFIQLDPARDLPLDRTISRGDEELGDTPVRVVLSPAMMRACPSGVFANDVVLPRVSEAQQWQWEQFEVMHLHFMAATLASIFSCETLFRSPVVLGDVLLGAQPSASPYLDLKLQLADVQSLVVTDAKQCLRADSDVDLVDVSDLTHMHKCCYSTHLVDGYFTVQLKDDDDDTSLPTYLTVFLQQRHSGLEVDGTISVKSMNTEYGKLERKLLLGEKWSNRKFVLVFVTNRRVLNDEGALPGVMYVSKDELEEHLHVFASRGLVPKPAMTRGDESE